MPSRRRLTPDWLVLFSGTSRRQYLQDVLDVLAQPEGAIHRFRYEVDIVSPSLRGAWSSNQLVGRDVLTVAALLDPVRYTTAAYLPLRRGKVVRTFEVDGTCVVDFSTGSFASLPPLDAVQPAELQDVRAAAVHTFTKALSVELQGGHPDGDAGRRIYAAAAPDPFAKVDGLATGTFANSVAYLQAAQPYNQFTFLRTVSIRDAAGKEVAMDGGILRVTAGQRFNIELSQRQSAQGSSREIRVVADDGLSVTSGNVLPLASDYDVLQIAVFAPARDNDLVSRIVVAPEPPDSGAHVDLNVEIRVAAGQRTTDFALSGLGAVAIAIPGVWDTGPLWAKLVLAIGGALSVAFALTRRQRRGQT